MENSICLENKLKIFLSQIEMDFMPRLTEKIDIDEFIRKIILKADLIIRYSSEGNIIGLTVLYCNNFSERKAYISLVGVLRNYRGKGIAKNMIENAILIAKKRHFFRIGLHSNNKKAQKLYRQLGFVSSESTERIYMELVL